MEPSASQLAEARRGKDPGKLAIALTEHADATLKSGQIKQAREMLDEAASLYHGLEREYDEARCSHLAATLCRLEGDFTAARKRLRNAQKLAAPGTPVSVSVQTELAEIAFAEKQGQLAADHYQRAHDEGVQAGLENFARAALLRKRANALTMAGESRAAAADLDRAHDLLLGCGRSGEATRALIEKASALYQAGDIDNTRTALATAFAEARDGGDEHALSDLHLLEATLALDLGNPDQALQSALAARDCALKAIAPMSYVSAAHAIAEINEAAKDHVAAYASLASGWATLGDIMGNAAARELFEPRLRALLQKWGAQNFEQVKKTYEAQRRAAIGRQAPELANTE